MAKKSSNIKNFTFLTAFSLSEKVIAFVYQAIIAAVLGAGAVTDCFFSASQLFDLIDATVLGALVVVIINRFANITAEKNENEGFRFLSKVNTLLTIFMISVAVLTFVLAKPFSFIIAPGFDDSSRQRLVECIRIMCVIPPVMVFATLAQGLLRQKKCFILVNSRSMFISLCGMAAVLFFSVRDPSNSRILCYGYVAANILFSSALFIRSRHFGVIGYSKPTIDDDVKKMIVLAGPAIIGKGIVRISLMIDQVISTMLGKGSVSYLNYAHSLYNIVNSLLIVNLCTIMLTEFTELCVEKKFDAMANKLSKSISSILLILTPVTIITMCFSKEIVSIVYERGAFTAESSAAVGSLLFFYAIGFIPAMLNSMHTQVLHSFGKMNVAMKISLISFAANIILNIALSFWLGIIGIALATTISAIIVIFVYKKAVSKSLPDYHHILDGRYVVRLVTSSALMTVIALLFKQLIHQPLLSVISATAVGFIGFWGTLYVMREDTLLRIVNKLLHKK